MAAAVEQRADVPRVGAARLEPPDSDETASVAGALSGAAVLRAMLFGAVAGAASRAAGGGGTCSVECSGGVW